MGGAGRHRTVGPVLPGPVAIVRTVVGGDGTWTTEDPHDNRAPSESRGSPCFWIKSIILAIIYQK